MSEIKEIVLVKTERRHLRRWLMVVARLRKVTEQDLSGYHRVASYRDFIDNFDSSAGEKELLFVTGSLYFISEVRAHLLGYESID